MLDIWPALPIAIEVSGILSPWQGTDDIVSLLEHHDRASDINLEGVPTVQLEAIRSLFRCLHTHAFLRKIYLHRCFPIRFWVDMLHVCEY